MSILDGSVFDGPAGSGESGGSGGALAEIGRLKDRVSRLERFVDENRIDYVGVINEETSASPEPHEVRAQVETLGRELLSLEARLYGVHDELIDRLRRVEGGLAHVQLWLEDGYGYGEKRQRSAPTKEESLLDVLLVTEGREPWKR